MEEFDQINQFARGANILQLYVSFTDEEIGEVVVLRWQSDTEGQ